MIIRVALFIIERNRQNQARHAFQISPRTRKWLKEKNLDFNIGMNYNSPTCVPVAQWIE